MFLMAHLLNLIPFLVSFCCTHSASSEIYHISPTLKSCSVDREPCVTLSQFAANSSQNLESNTTLVLLEGNHTLDTQLTIEGIVAFSINSGQNVTCVNESVIYLHNISNVQLHSMKFRGCRIEVEAVNNMFIENNYFTDFEDTFDGFRVLQLTLTNANILNTRFSGISISSDITSDNGILKASCSDVKIQGVLLENSKANFGLAFFNCTVVISHSNFKDNEVYSAKGEIGIPYSESLGGVLYFDKYCRSISITHSTFIDNNIRSLSERKMKKGGGVLFSTLSASKSMELIFCNFRNNTGSGDINGGAIHVLDLRPFNLHVTSVATVYIYGCTFTNNSAFAGGAVYVDCFQTNLDVSDSIFIANTAHGGGGGAIFVDTIGNVNIDGCIFWSNVNVMRASSNTVNGNGGAVFCDTSGDLKLVNTDFTNNEALSGGAVYVDRYYKLFVQESNFSSNNANNGNGGAMVIRHVYNDINEINNIINITNSTFIDNIATGDGGGLYIKGRRKISESDFKLIITFSFFRSNQAKAGNGGALALDDVKEVAVNTNEFYHNLAKNGGALYVKVVFCFNDYVCKLYNVITNISQCRFTYNGAVRGGAIYMIDSQSIYFSSSINITDNFADYGGAVFSGSCRLSVFNKVMMSINSAKISGGAVYLNNSELICQDGGRITLERNKANYRGGGMYASNSSFIISTVRLADNVSSFISFSQNRGEEGGGLYLCKGSKLSFQISSNAATCVYFTDNRARFGKDLFIFDESVPDSLLHNSSIIQCFVQVSHPTYNNMQNYTEAIHFKTDSVTRINVMKTKFGMCKVGQHPATSELDNLKGLSNIKNSNIDSLSFRLCFCKDGFPDCTYRPSAREMQKFSVEVTLVNQFNHMISANIITTVIEGGVIPSNQQRQRIKHFCTNLNFTVYSQSYVQELVMTLNCKTPYHCFNDQIKLSVHVNACKFCPTGFEMLSDEIKGCDCVCDSTLLLNGYIHDCNYSAGVVIKQHSTAWINYISIENSSGYLIYRYCPNNYCLPPETMVEINLNIPNGADAQCSNNRGGLLCGSCINGSTLSLGSAHCIECNTHWPIVLVVLIISGIVGGIILVASFLVLNLTVAVGTLNGIIFYANIVAANGRTFFPSRYFLTVFISWINLELGIDTCLFKGMDAYWKTWIELALPTYLIALVIIIIIVSEKSMRFSNLIGKKNPVATLDTIVLLSYVKFLRVIISSYSFAILDYPDHSRRLVWLPDATVQYFSGKHIPLFIASTLVLLVGVAYTSLLLCWQWLLRYQDVKCLAWIRHQHLRLFIVPYHAPYKPKHRYWTGLLLLVRIVVYIISAATLSMDHTISIIAIGIATSILLMLSTNRPYNKRPIGVMEVISFTNIICLCLATVFLSKGGKGQDIVACISGNITFIMFLIVLSYHILTELCFKTKFGKALKQKFGRRKDTEEYESKREEEEEGMPLTFSEVPAPRGDSNRAEGKGEIPHTKCTDTFELKVQSSPNDPVPYHLMQ